MNNLTFSQAIEGYLLNAGARHLSPHTIVNYLNTSRKFEDYAEDDLCFVAVSQNDVQEFLAAQTKLSNKTLLNYHTGLSALWSWAASERADRLGQYCKRILASPTGEAENSSTDIECHPIGWHSG